MYVYHIYAWVLVESREEMKFQMAVNYHISAGNRTQVLGKSNGALNCWAGFPNPKIVFCLFVTKFHLVAQAGLKLTVINLS